MYLEFYGLNEMPFDLAPNPRFLHFSPRHREAFNHLLYGLRERKGFVQLTGEVGCGKTTLCRAMLRELGDGFATALILNPWLGPGDLLPAVAAEFGLAVGSSSPRETLHQLNHFLLELVHQNRDAVLIIDEAQDLTPDQLEEIRLLSNLETDDSKLLQILLVGQPELTEKLARPELRQLRQRIVLRHELRPFDEEETGAYVDERLRLAGHTGKEVFKRSAVRTIWERTGGVPRLVNVVCDSALLLGFARGWTTLGRGAILEVARDLDLPATPPRRPGEADGSLPARWTPFGLFRRRSAGRA